MYIDILDSHERARVGQAAATSTIWRLLAIKGRHGITAAGDEMRPPGGSWFTPLYGWALPADAALKATIRDLLNRHDTRQQLHGGVGGLGIRHEPRMAASLHARAVFDRTVGPAICRLWQGTTAIHEEGQRRKSMRVDPISQLATTGQNAYENGDSTTPTGQVSNSI